MVEMDRFEHAVPNKHDKLFVISFFLLLATVFIFNFLQSDSLKSFGNTYIIFFLLVFGLLGFAITSNGGFTREVIYGDCEKVEDVYKHILVGALFGGVLCLGGYLGLSFLSSLQVPLAFTFTTSTTSTSTNLSPNLAIEVSSIIILLIVNSIFAVETEEALRASSLVPTFMQLSAPVTLLFAALITTQFPGFTIATVSFIGIAVLLGVKRDWSKRIARSSKSRHVFAIIVAATVFGLFHIYAGQVGGNIEKVMLSAFMFALAADAINWKLNSTISSRIAHSINNTYLFVTTNAIDARLGIFVIVIYALIIILIFNGTEKSTKGKAGVIQRRPVITAGV
jgi:hypothetical protein